jgi:D-lactate dehydrogenase
MKVAVYSTKEFERSFLEVANAGNHELLFFEESLSAETALLAKGCHSVCLFTNDDAGAAVLQKLHDLKVNSIATRAAGHDNIDLQKAEALGLSVANVPEYSPYAIAEHTIAMILAMNRKIVRADKQVKEYNFSLDNLVGFDLHGKTVGILGLGRIGGILTKILHAFGCKILAYDLVKNQTLIDNYHLEYVDLPTLCGKSDIISLHAPLTAQTKHIINKDNIALMKKGVMIVNTGRGGLINTIDVLESLKSGKIGYLGMDVYENEKGLFFNDHREDLLQDELFARLLSYKNVLITGHQAFLTEDALKNIADTTMYNLNSFASNEISEHELTDKAAIVK